MSRLLSTPVFLVAGLLLGAGGQPLGDQISDPRRHVVTIRAFEYRPATLEVVPGDTVVWINHDIVPHTATAERGDWDSGDIEPGGAWRHIVMAEGTVRYTCTYHPKMQGSLKVKTEDEASGDYNDDI